MSAFWRYRHPGGLHTTQPISRSKSTTQGADDDAGESLDFSDLVRAVIRRLIREPLLHFALLGGAIFAAYAAFAPVKPESSRIFITENQIVSIEAQFHNTWQRSPTLKELTALIENRVREEVLYREGIALGLDRDNPVIRGRVRQKVEFLSEDMFNKEPTEADLKEYFASHRELFEEPPVFTFEQVYFDPARHGAGLGTEISARLPASVPENRPMPSVTRQCSHRGWKTPSRMTSQLSLAMNLPRGFAISRWDSGRAPFVPVSVCTWFTLHNNTQRGRPCSRKCAVSWHASGTGLDRPR